MPSIWTSLPIWTEPTPGSADDDRGASVSRPPAQPVHGDRTGGSQLPERGSVVQPPYVKVCPNKVSFVGLDGASQDDLSAIRQLPDGHGIYPARAAQWLPDRGTVVEPPHPYRAVVTAADNNRGAVVQMPGGQPGHVAGVCAQRLPDGSSILQPPYPYCRHHRR